MKYTIVLVEDEVNFLGIFNLTGVETEIPL